VGGAHLLLLHHLAYLRQLLPLLRGERRLLIVVVLPRALLLVPQRVHLLLSPLWEQLLWELPPLSQRLTFCQL